MMKQAQQMQKKLMEAQEKVAQLEATGTSGGGMLSVTLNGKGEAKKVAIDPKLIDPDDPEMLEDLVVAAINDAKKKVDDATTEEMSTATGGMQLPPGMNIPF